MLHLSRPISACPGLDAHFGGAYGGEAELGEAGQVTFVGARQDMSSKRSYLGKLSATYLIQTSDILVANNEHT